MTAQGLIAPAIKSFRARTRGNPAAHAIAEDRWPRPSPRSNNDSVCHCPRSACSSQQPSSTRYLRRRICLPDRIARRDIAPSEVLLITGVKLEQRRCGGSARTSRADQSKVAVTDTFYGGPNKQLWQDTRTRGVVEARAARLQWYAKWGRCKKACGAADSTMERPWRAHGRGALQMEPCRPCLWWLPRIRSLPLSSGSTLRHAETPGSGKSHSFKGAMQASEAATTPRIGCSGRSGRRSSAKLRWRSLVNLGGRNRHFPRAYPRQAGSTIWAKYAERCGRHH